MKEEKLKQNKMPRRCFLSNCAKFAAGASLLGYGLKTFGNKNDSYLDYSYCVFKCELPCSFDFQCTGCRNDNTGERLTCTVRNCVIENDLPSCAHCNELATCQKDLWKDFPYLRDNALRKRDEWNLTSNSTNIKIKNEEFDVYPNITNNSFTIRNAKQLNVDYKLYNIKGQIVNSGKFNSKEYNIDISNLSPDYYILSIIKNNEVLYVNKIIKK